MGELTKGLQELRGIVTPQEEGHHLAGPPSAQGLDYQLQIHMEQRMILSGKWGNAFPRLCKVLLRSSVEQYSFGFYSVYHQTSKSGASEITKLSITMFLGLHNAN